jgi:DNA-binding transcriptional LysR family regulator
MDARQLEYFLAVADNGTFNRAAASLYLAQPSLSQAIRNLERELGTELFHRIGRRIELTEAGRAMIGPARQVLRDLESARATVESVKGLRTGRLEIASMPSPAVQPLSEMIGVYLRKYPAIRVDVRAVPTAAEAAAQVRTGAVEIGLAGTASELRSAEVTVHPAGQQRFVLLAPPGGPLPPGRAVTLDDLAGLTAIAAPPGTRARQLVGAPRDGSAAGDPGHRGRGGHPGVGGPGPRCWRARAGPRTTAVPAHLPAVPARAALTNRPGVPGHHSAWADRRSL